LNGKYDLKICCLGVLYHRWKKYDKAEQLYQQALEINPQLQSTKDNMALLYKARNRVANWQWYIASASPSLLKKMIISQKRVLFWTVQ